MEEEQGNFTQEGTQSESNLKKQFTTVTPLSKYLAMIIFISMPFIGIWIGLKLAPVEVVEIEKIIIREEKVVESQNEGNVARYQDWTLYESEYYPISFYHPSNLSVASGDSAVYGQDPVGFHKIRIYDGMSDGDFASVIIYEKQYSDIARFGGQIFIEDKYVFEIVNSILDNNSDFEKFLDSLEL